MHIYLAMWLMRAKRCSAFQGHLTFTRRIMSSSNSTKLSSQELMDLEYRHSAHNYHPIPVVWSKAQGIHVWDPEGKRYMDFLSAYSSANQGHCHPSIIKTMTEQASKLTLSSRAFYNDQLGLFAQYITKLLGYDMVLPMNTGAEGVETAIKLARKWGYMKKGIPENEAIIFGCQNSFHGRTLGAISLSSDPQAKGGFGPFVPLLGSTCPSTGSPLRYNNINDLKAALEAHGSKTAAFIVEPIQGEAGVIVPEKGYLKKCAELCRQYNVLLIADEIQTGLGRTGAMLAVDHEEVKPDIVILGKALSGGTLPISAILANKDIMLCIKPGEHGSTYGGNPLACAVSMAALQVIIDQDLCRRAAMMGEDYFIPKLKALNSPIIKEVRGKGLLCAIELDKSVGKKTAWDLCLLLKEHGILTKPTHENIIRLSPPLIIEKDQLDEAVESIHRALSEFQK